MKLYQINKLIEGLVLNYPNVGEYGYGDIYELMNQSRTIEYAKVVLTHQNTSIIDGELRRHTFNIFYVDRMLDDESNKVEIQSQGQEVLEEILGAIDAAGVYVAEQREYVNFTQKFADLCAGVYCTFSVQVPIEDCGGDEFKVVNSINGKSGEVWMRIPDVSDYYTKSEVDSLVDSATSGLPTPQEFNEMEEQLEGKADSTALTSVYQTVTAHTSDSSIHLTSGAVQTQINNSISGKADASVVSALAEDVAANYYTKDETDAIISEQGDSHIDKLEVGQIDMTTHSSAGTCNINGVNKITASSGDIASLSSNTVNAASVNVQYMGSSKNLASWISQKLDASAYTPTDLSEYWTSAQTQSAITSAVSGKANSSDVYTKSEVDSAIEEATSGSVSNAISGVSFNGSAATVVNRVATITANVGEDNVIETVKVNGSALTVTNKAVDIAMPRFEVNNGILNIITQ